MAHLGLPSRSDAATDKPGPGNGRSASCPEQASDAAAEKGDHGLAEAPREAGQRCVRYDASGTTRFAGSDASRKRRSRMPVDRAPRSGTPRPLPLELTPPGPSGKL